MSVLFSNVVNKIYVNIIKIKEREREEQRDRV